MRMNDFICRVVVGMLWMTGCQKEIHIDPDPSEGSLQKDGGGDCLPKSVNGIYMQGVQLTSTHTIIVDVNVTAIGSYLIYSDTVNGYYFRAVGVFTASGTNTIILHGSGVPSAIGRDPFTITYKNSSCNIKVPVVTSGGGGGTAAVFTLAGSPNSCTSVINGTYASGTALNATNTIDISVDVTTAGAYSISTTPVNGIMFSGSGNLTTVNHTITLTGSGSPTISGNFTIPLSFGASNCNFPLTVVPGAPINWMFTAISSGASAITYQGFTSDAFVTSSGGLAVLSIKGTTTDSSGTFAITLSNTDGYIVDSVYSGTANTGKFATFIFREGPLVYLGSPQFVSNIPVNLTTYDTTTHTVKGTFSGLAGNGLGGTIYIAAGSFKANLP